MGKGKEQTTTQSQTAQSDPWDQAQPILSNLIAGYNGISIAPTAAQQNAVNQLTSGASAIPNFGSSASGTLDKAFNFSTAPQIGMLSSAFGALNSNLGDIASGKYIDPLSTPGFGDALATVNSDITKQVKNAYAGSGRSPSGAGSFAGSLGRGLSQGQGALISDQYNKNVAAMQGANNMLFGAAGTTANNQAQLGMLPISLGMQGISAIPSASSAYTSPGATALTAANAAYNMPYGNLLALLQPGIALGSLGGQTSGTGTSTQQQSGSLFGDILGGVGAGAGLLSATGAGGSSGWLAPLLMSDERSKTEIEPVGKTFDGQTIHRYRYKGDPRMQIGLLAGEVEKRDPDAVGMLPIGMKGVDYRRATARAAEMGRAA